MAALIGAEAGAAFGLIVFGNVPLAPLALAAGGAACGPVAAAVVARLERRLVKQGIREQLRRAHRGPRPRAGRTAEH